MITRMDCGGSAVNTLLCASEQQSHGHQVTLAYGLSLESDMSKAEQARVDAGVQAFKDLGGRVVLLQALLRGLGFDDIRAYREIKLLLKQGFDVLHSHTSKAGALARLAAKGMGLIVVHTPHGHIFHGYFGSLKTYLFVLVERYLASSSDALIALTKAERDDHLDLNIGDKKQWQVIPSGVDVQMIEQTVASYRLYEDIQWDAVSVGRLVPIKAMYRLIRAWHKVCESQPQARLALVGDGEEKAGLEALVFELGLTENVHFAAWADPLPYLASARCFALLSYNEGMGRAVVEAMAAGLPCVVSDVCGLKELVDDSLGCVVDADRPDIVAKALLKQWDKHLGDRVRLQAKQYSVAVMIDALEKLYTDLKEREYG